MGFYSDNLRASSSVANRKSPNPQFVDWGFLICRATDKIKGLFKGEAPLPLPFLCLSSVKLPRTARSAESLHQKSAFATCSRSEQRLGLT